MIDNRFHMRAFCKSSGENATQQYNILRRIYSYRGLAVLLTMLLIKQIELQRSFGHVQNTQPDSKRVLDDGALADSNFKWRDQHLTPSGRKRLHCRHHIIHQIVDLNAGWYIRLVMQANFCIRFREGKADRSFMLPEWAQPKDIRIICPGRRHIAYLDHDAINLFQHLLALFK